MEPHERVILQEAVGKLKTFGDYRDGTADRNLTLAQAIFISDVRRLLELLLEEK